ncbi:MAG: peptidoglycan-binding domain-containing protein [Gammaproteobacteria bacterium]
MKIRHVLIASLLVFGFASAPLGLAATAASSPGTQTNKEAMLNHGQYHNYTQAQMKSLQQALTAKGFPVKATGMWDQTTRDAIKAFQKKNGMKVTGYPNAKTRKALGLDW